MAAKKKAAGKWVRVAEGIYRRGETYGVPIYHAELNDGRGGKRWHSVNCGPECRHVQIVDKDSAREAKRELERTKKMTVRNGLPEETVDEWAIPAKKGELPRWLQLFPRKEMSTNIHNAGRVKSFGKAFAGRTFRSLTEDEMFAWAEGNANVKEVRAMLNDAKRMRLLDENPLNFYRLAQRKGRRDIETLTLEELDLLLRIARETWGDYGPRMEALIELAAWTGMRPGELFLLSAKPGNELNGGRVNQIHTRGWIDVQWQWNAKMGEIKRPKWDSMRQVALLPRARAAFERLPSLPEGWLFLTQRDARFSQRNLHYYWDPVRRKFTDSLPSSHWLPRRIVDKGPVEGNLDFYELRHFFGTALAHPPAGIRPASPYEIAQQMGHKDGGQLAMRVYIHTKGSDVVRDLGEAWASHAPRERGAA